MEDIRCPHCRTAIYVDIDESYFDSDKEGAWYTRKGKCPSCKKLFITLKFIDKDSNEKYYFVYPRSSSRPPCPSEVPKKYSDDYKEACLVLNDSPKASSALSRRCVQNIIREEAKIKKSSLNDEIDELIKSKTVPSHITESIDAIRNIGNFAAHPIKSKSSGEIVDVELGEAEWNLDVLEALFDFYFVQPSVIKKKRDALNKKLKDAGKPPMK